MDTIPNEFKIIMPKESVPRPKYYDVYVKYVLNILKINNLDISYEGVDNDARFVIKINNKKIAIDYSDHPIIDSKLLKLDAYFKFHCKHEHMVKHGIIPFAPTSFYDWERYKVLRKQIHYTCNNNVVLNVQKPYGNAVVRRKQVRGVLYNLYRPAKNLIYSPYYPQEDYWKLINNCLVHVFVPGCYNDMLDRGHLQYLGFGCCTISPKIVDLLPWKKCMIPGTHYIECAPDYSDIVEKVEWCKENREECIRIGKNAQRLFDSCCTPSKLWKWIVVNTFKGE